MSNGDCAVCVEREQRRAFAKAACEVCKRDLTDHVDRYVSAFGPLSCWRCQARMEEARADALESELATLRASARPGEGAPEVTVRPCSGAVGVFLSCAPGVFYVDEKPNAEALAGALRDFFAAHWPRWAAQADFEARFEAEAEEYRLFRADAHGALEEAEQRHAAAVDAWERRALAAEKERDALYADLRRYRASDLSAAVAAAVEAAVAEERFSLLSALWRFSERKTLSSNERHAVRAAYSWIEADEGRPSPAAAGGEKTSELETASASAAAPREVQSNAAPASAPREPAPTPPPCARCGGKQLVEATDVLGGVMSCPECHGTGRAPALASAAAPEASAQADTCVICGRSRVALTLEGVCKYCYRAGVDDHASAQAAPPKAVPTRSRTSHVCPWSRRCRG